MQKKMHVPQFSLMVDDDSFIYTPSEKSGKPRFLDFVQ